MLERWKPWTQFKAGNIELPKPQKFELPKPPKAVEKSKAGIELPDCPPVPNLHGNKDVLALIEDECNAVCDLLLTKNAAYGNSFANPAMVFSRSSAEEQINVRIDDKLKRIMNQNRDAKDAVPEDTEQDLIGYLILKRVLRKLNRKDS